MRVRLASKWNVFIGPWIVGISIAPALAGEIWEREENNTVGGAALLRLHELGRGQITPVGDLDVWWNRQAAAGDVVFAYADSSESNTGSDSFLSVVAHDGVTNIQSDEGSGPGASAAVAGAVVTQPGNVFCVVTEGGSNDEITPYRLYQAVINSGRSATEIEGNDTAASANIINEPIMAGLVVGGSGDLDFYEFNVPANVRVAVVLDDDPDRDGQLTDTHLDILDTDGTTVLATGDNGSSRPANAAGAILTVTAGTRLIRVGNGNAGNDSDYRFVLFVNGVAYSDGDADGSPDTDDNCPVVFNPSQSDAEGDGFGDACDGCIYKSTPGICGCDQPDVDIDGDGVADCGATRESILATIGLLLVPDSTNTRILAFDPFDGDYLFPFLNLEPTQTDEPVKAILSADQLSILVSDSKFDAVQRYDLNGTFQETFAPAGGVDNSIMDGPGAPFLMPDGTLLVGSGAGLNGHAISRFNSAGVFLGNLVAPGAGGLSLAMDYLLRGGELLVADDSAAAVRVFDAANGAFLKTFGSFEETAVPQQIVQLNDGHILVASVSAVRDRGIFEFDATGTRVNQLLPGNALEFRGVFELENGNFLVTCGGRLATASPTANGSVFVMNRAGQIVETKISRLNARLISFVKLDADGDGIGDGLDGCPNDSAKASPGACGCGAPDTDDNENGTPDCIESPASGQSAGCCAPGVFPTVGILTPVFMMGWKVRRRSSRRRQFIGRCIVMKMAANRTSKPRYVVLAWTIATSFVATARAQDCNGNGVPDAVEFEGRVVWVDFSSERVQQAGLDGSNVQDVVSAGLMGPQGVGLDWDAGKVYWTDQSSKKIQRSNFDGSGVEDLVTMGLNSPYDIDIDSSGGKMYWTDLSNKKIQRANLDGTEVQDIVTAGLAGPYGIAVDSINGKVYWAENNSRKIQRANLDGTLVQDLVTMATGGLDQPSGIALDVAGGKMYWTDWGSKKIQRANLDGTDVQDLVTTGLMTPVGIAVDPVGGKMYWTDSQAKKIVRANLDGTVIETVVGAGLDGPEYIAVAPPRIDVDADGVFDSCDTCPADAAKTAPGACGCGIPDTDANANGTADCIETVMPSMPPMAATVCCAPGSFLSVGLLMSAWAVTLGTRRRGRRAAPKPKCRALPSRQFPLNCAVMFFALIALPARAQFDVPVSSAIPLNSNATTDTVHADGYIQLASDSAGHWVAVWTGTDPFGTMSGGNKIFCAASSNNGAMWNPMIRVDQYGGVMPSGHSNDPRIATDGQGHWIIVWDSHDTLGGAFNNRYKVMFARSDDNGATWTDMDPLNNLSTPTYNFEEDHAAIASDGAGNWIVVWSLVDNVFDADPGVAMSRSTDNGMTWTDPVIIATEIAPATEPRIAADGEGRWVVVYHSKNELGGIGNDWDILYTRSTDHGVTWSPQAPLNSHAATDPLGNPGADLYPDIAADGMGNWIAVWISQVDLGGLLGEDEDILYAVSTDHGATWGPSGALNTYAAGDDRGDQFPAIASDRQGNWITLWNSNESLGGTIGFDFDILASRSEDNGVSWSAPAAFNSFAASDSNLDTDQRPAIATDGSGNWVGAWMSNYNLGGLVGTDYDIISAGASISVCDSGSDLDGDGVFDHCDNCPNSANADQADTDADGHGDVCDNCMNEANVGQANSDGDSEGDACDECSNDPAKTSPGICGCGETEVDRDGDGVADCVDSCADDALKAAPGLCGCGAADTDSDGNGVPDCADSLPGPQQTMGGSATACCAPNTAAQMPFLVCGLMLMKRRGTGRVAEGRRRSR